MFRSFCLVLVLASAAHAEEIPLDSIWAKDMPGTQDVQKLKSECLGEIVEALGFRNWPAKGKEAGQAFVVRGSGKDALCNARDVFSGKEPKAKTQPQGESISLVFYTFATGYYGHLREVTRDANEINIKYSLVPHRTRELTNHFALIPLRELPAGKYRVVLSEVPLPEGHADAGLKPLSESDKRRYVCGPTTFTIGGKADED